MVSVQRKFRRCDDEEARVSGRSRGPAAAFNRASQAVLTLASISRRRTACRRSTRIRGSSKDPTEQPSSVTSSVAERSRCRGPSGVCRERILRRFNSIVPTLIFLDEERGDPCNKSINTNKYVVERGGGKDQERRKSVNWKTDVRPATASVSFPLVVDLSSVIFGERK